MVKRMPHGSSVRPHKRECQSDGECYSADRLNGRQRDIHDHRHRHGEPREGPKGRHQGHGAHSVTQKLGELVVRLAIEEGASCESKLL
jgi:hypothetical protein